MSFHTPLTENPNTIYDFVTQEENAYEFPITVIE